MDSSLNKIIVTGGSGLVGSHLKNFLPSAVYLSSKDCDLTDLSDIRKLIMNERPHTVVHLAARVGGILDNINYPVDYLEENILMNTNLLRVCHEFNVTRVLAVLSTCIYPNEVQRYPMVEEDLFEGSPAESNFSYAIAKRCLAAQIDSYVKQYGKKWCYLIPCNLYGEYDKFDFHNSHYVSSLLRKIYEAKSEITLWGSGKPLRQFMYGEDLARVIKIYLDRGIDENCNVSPKEVLSIDEIAKIAIKACGKPNLKIKYDTSKPDGQFRKDVSSKKLLSIVKDFKFTSLEEGIKKTYKNVKF